MGKYVKKLQVQNVKKTTTKGPPKKKSKLKRKGKKVVSAPQTNVAKNEESSIEAASKLAASLGKLKNEKKVEDALRKSLNTSGGQPRDVLGAALHHCAGRGFTTCVRLLVQAGASLNYCETGQTTSLQIAASRGHVDVCQLLIQAGADRTGAMEAAQKLSQLGATFVDERKRIQAMLAS
mmetsp:Transcript_105737/g.166924  ORF Transcript_105737/g.166924 Transcript_105737/m.166924 type:complete len:179 (+) Transcript_105737:77-613(+)